MALREIREIGDEALRAVCKPIKEMTPRIAELIEDLFDTMYEADGVGLAAPQVGVRKRICVIDTAVGEGEDPDPVCLINPEILESADELEGREGCLSVPGKYGIVKRPTFVKVRFLNENMEEVILTADGLKARAIQHEMDHLDGILYVDKAGKRVYDVTEEDEEEEEAPEGEME